MRLKSLSEIESIGALVTILGILAMIFIFAVTRTQRVFVGFILGVAFSAYLDRLYDLIVEEDSE